MADQPPLPHERPSPPQEPLRSVFTNNLPAIFEQLGISLAVSTYQAGKVVLVRQDGGTLNTHFRTFHKPMGIAADALRLTIGGANSVWYYRNMPAVAPKLEPPGKHDAAYLPRQIHVTGDIDIHELAWAGDDTLWVVNTKFGCLCTLDADHSFVPRWRPPFLSALAPEDRCHLNGIAIVEGRPRFVTALGETDTPGGWRDNKRDGGLLMDVEHNQILLRGLSMPHSPRLHAGHLWVLESGQGSLARVDLEAGTWRTVATLPGFTRGLDFVGPLAFIGLSQVRESATFSGIPLVERLQERVCGVWVVNWQTGETLGFLRFETGVQEVFAVQALPARFPEMLEWGDARLHTSYVLPDEALREVPAPLRGVHEQATPVPDEVARLVNEADALLKVDQPEEALARLEEARTLAPEVPEIYNNWGNALVAQNRLPEAVVQYERAIALRHRFSDAHLNLAMALLKQGHYERGFREWEWRWQTQHFTPFNPPRPSWQGQPLRGTLLVHTEQGAGDAIQFARFLPQAAQKVERLHLVAPEPLQALLATAGGVDEVRGPGTIEPADFAAYVPLMSLPAVLGTTLATLPAELPYLHAPEGTPLLLPLAPPDHLRVGIVWAGSPTQGNDRNRSTTLHTLTPLFEVPGVAWYSFQVGHRAAELTAHPGPAPIHNLADHLHTWADTAAALEQLDLLISVDTGVAHLASALGKPVWVLLTYAPDWRWMLQRPDSPWYPTARLCRQRRPGAWHDLVVDVAQQLASYVSPTDASRCQTPPTVSCT